MSYDSQFLKWKMEQVWQQRGCVSPNHLANWHTYERWVYDRNPTTTLLWFTRGKLMRGRSRKPKGKGFSFLHKGYQVAWRSTKLNN